MVNSLPKRWLNYNPVGSVIEGTNIVAFKVPLKESMVQLLQPEHRFTVRKLLGRFPRLRCVIDLTDTDRYYNPKELTDAGVRYEKLKIRGQQIPTEDNVKQFFRLLDELMATCTGDEIVGVHCTHGINRTGYLICRYFVQRLNWDVENSIATFSQARGHSIERESYVDDLRKVGNSKVPADKIKLLDQQGRPMRNLTRFPLPTNAQRFLAPVAIATPMPATITTASLSSGPLRSNVHPAFTNAANGFLGRMPSSVRRQGPLWTENHSKRHERMAGTMSSSHHPYSTMSPLQSRLRFKRINEHDFTTDTPEENMITLNRANIDRFCSQKK